MSLALMYYLITVVGGLKKLLGTSSVILFLTLVALGLILLFNLDQKDEGDYKSFLSISKRMLAPLAVLITLTVAVPSKKDMTIIAGLSLGEKGAAKVVEEAGEFYPLLKKILKKELTEMTEEM